jgi:hypothetical protein
MDLLREHLWDWTGRLWVTALHGYFNVTVSDKKVRSVSAAVCVAQLCTLDIPPAEWLLHRIEVFGRSPLRDQVNLPPANFVWSPGALARAVTDEGGLDFLGRLAEPRIVMTSEALDLIARWHRTRRELVRLRGASLPLPPDAWDWYEPQLDLVVHANARRQQVLNQRVADGEFVWARGAFE